MWLWARAWTGLGVGLLWLGCSSAPAPAGDGAPQCSTPAGDEICGDRLDENCNPDDEACPTSMDSAIAVPDWDCVSMPIPDNVVAWARFAEPNEYFEAGACFVFFEGLPDEFYTAPLGLTPTPARAMRGPNGACEAVEGCICPSIMNWSYDRGRLYALTLEGAPSDCEKIVVYSHEGDQVVSNDCRKFLYQIHFNRQGYSFVSNGLPALQRRLARFDQVEIACFEGQPFDDLPFASLLTTQIELNPGFEKQ